jgi:hypothetical protein
MCSGAQNMSNLGHMDDNEQLSKNRGLYIWGDFCLVLCVCVA